MHRIYFPAIPLVWGLMSLSTLSFATDQYTYRAGQAYMKIAAGSHTECEAQCRGDAACRGWNFIRPNPRSLSGICEFNALQAAPISSPISISGEINTSIDTVMSRAVPTSIGRTIRVGTPIIPRKAAKQAAVKRPIRAPQMANVPANVPQMAAPKRIIKRLPVDDVIRAPIPAGYKPISAAQLQPLTGPVQTRSMTRQQIYREQMLAAQKRAEAQARLTMQQAQYSAVATPRPPQQFVPKMNQLPIQAPRQAPRQAPVQATMIPARAPMNPQSLYGSLHDDLTQNMTPVPRPQTAPDQFDNPDAPLSTNCVIQAVPVQVAPLGYPVIPGQQVPGQQLLDQQLQGLAGG